MSRAIIIDDGSERVTLKASYNPKFQAEFRREIPYRSREWTGEVWFVHRSCLDTLIAISERHFGHTDVRIEKPPVESQGDLFDE